MNKRFIFSGIIALMVVTPMFNSCGNKADNKKAQDSTESAAKLVDTASVITGSINIEEEFTAAIISKVKNNISAQMGGRVEKIYVKVGDRVSQGQALARMEGSQLSQIRVQLDKAKTDFARMDELYKIGGISKSQWESAKTAMEIARSQYGNLAQNTSLRSPISGLVTAKNYDDGDVTSPQLPILTVEQISPVKLVINVSEDYYKSLKLKMPVNITVDALGDKPFEGYVSLIHPTIDPMSHTFTVEIEIANKDQQIRPGMYARVNMSFGNKESVLVPYQSVMKQPGSGDRYVYLYDEGKAHYCKVEAGKVQGKYFEVISGLKPGQVVITAGLNNLTDGGTVKIKKG
ncbi:efflux RND transporter periplasmic adaptor subunit [Porphyromonas pogonae]|uniref:efflux RND transporter periplasmic adaptor subunit n=1 Tax=Porphyromonas pogonae TaxID=867595 RepID=UPI002E7A7E73|nr:efflux RND transporter periplasmic adaptor subunit [Porphyromonas pogonae]